MSLSLDAFPTQYQAKITTQEYTKKPVIEGVKIIDLRVFNEDGGCFEEIVRLDENGNLEGLPEFKVRQGSYSQVMPGTVKGFHLHFNQEDVWHILPTSRMLIGLLDIRKDSPTFNKSMRFLMGAGRGQLLLIPRGVAHGMANVGTEPSNIVYFTNQQFNAENPDERRLPWDTLGADFWQVTMG